MLFVPATRERDWAHAPRWKSGLSRRRVVPATGAAFVWQLDRPLYHLALSCRKGERLRFADFRARGLPNGSGAVESAVRGVVNLRMKGASIAWTQENAGGLLHLRAHVKSGRWNELEAAVLFKTGWRPTCRNPKRVHVA